jgi:transposase
MTYLGIDVSKLKLDCTLLLDPDNNKRKSKVVPNSRAGAQDLILWCAKHGVGVDALHAVLEATGPYHEQAATTLHEGGVTVSIANPANVHDFSRALAMRSKTDALDSLVLARYGVAMRPAAWQPPPVHVRELRALITQLEALSKDRVRTLNRQEKLEASSASELVARSINDTLSFYDQEIARLEKAIKDHIDRHPDLKDDAKLLLTIPGVGPKVTRAMLRVMHTHPFKRAEDLAAYLGLVPVQRQSGTSLRGRSRMSKAGPADVRALMYMAGVVAAQHNPHVRALYQRLLAAGKTKMSALGACMRKLAHLCFGVLKTRQAYRPDYAFSA